MSSGATIFFKNLALYNWVNGFISVLETNTSRLSFNLHTFLTLPLQTLNTLIVYNTKQWH